LGVTATITQNPVDIAAATHIILPGVGAFDTVARQVDALQLRPVLTEAALQRGVPFLGICVGMQLLYAGSQEGTLAGLGWFKESLVAFAPNQLNEQGRPLRIPHMGWNVVAHTDGIPLFDGFGNIPPRFYFVHSYHAPVVTPTCEDLGDDRRQAIAHYGQPFVAAVQRQNIMGVQFHPEKSHRFGLQLFRNFVKLPSPYNYDMQLSQPLQQESAPC
jgi:glutamine amidotransferase